VEQRKNKQSKSDANHNKRHTQGAEIVPRQETLKYVTREPIPWHCNQD